MATRKLQIEILGDASSLERAFGRAGKKTSAFGDGLRKASYVAVGAFAAMGVAAKIGFDELAEGQRVSAQTAAVLKSTGAVANVTTKDIEGLARSLSGLTGIDDEAIQANENLLLTFKNVHNEVGKGADIFDRATKASLDLSVAGFGALDSTAKMLGKALNDPVRGMTALSRAGVTFSESQKKTIKALVETGDVLGAQKLIMKEVESQVGGSAKAYGETLPGQLAKARIAFEEMAAHLMQALVPALTKMAEIVSRASAFFAEHSTLAKALVVVVASLASVVLITSAAYKVYGAYQVIAAAATAVWTAAQWLLNAALTANPIGLVIVAVAALVAGIIIAWRESETFRRIVTGAFEAVKGAADAVLGFFRRNWPIIAVLISGPFAPIVLLATDLFGVRSALVNAFMAVKNWVSNNWPIIATIISGPFAPLVALATDAFGVRSALTGAFQAVKREVSESIQALIDKLAGFRAAILWVGNNAIRVFSQFADALGAALAPGLAALQSLYNLILGIKGGLVSLVDKVGSAIDALGKIPSLPDIPGFQHGVKNFGGGLAVVGEKGPELVNLRRGADVIPMTRGEIVPSGVSGSSSGGVTNVYVTVSNLVSTENDLVDAIQAGLIRKGFRNGGLGFT